MKIAAMEGLWETEQPASFSLFAIHDQPNHRSDRDLRLPFLLSVLAHNNTTAPVQGIKALQAEAEAKYGPGDYAPPVAWVYWSFRVMVGLGLLFIALTGWGLVTWWRGRLDTSRGWQRAALIALFLPFVANTAGWMVTELGRQPWIVYGLLRTADGVSPIVSSTMVWISMVGFTVIYAVLAAIGFFLMHRHARPQTATSAEAPELAPGPAY